MDMHTLEAATTLGKPQQVLTKFYIPLSMPGWCGGDGFLRRFQFACRLLTLNKSSCSDINLGNIKTHVEIRFCPGPHNAGYIRISVLLSNDDSNR
jgi:hypothetical protein